MLYVAKTERDRHMTEGHQSLVFTLMLPFPLAEKHNPDDGTLWKLTADHGKRCPSLYSQEIQVETYAIAKANFLLKGETMRTTWRGLEYLTISDRPVLVTTAGRKSGEREKDNISIAARPN